MSDYHRRSQHSAPSRHRRNDHSSSRSKSNHDYYGEDRIKRRHEILEVGVPSVWGESPRIKREDTSRSSVLEPDRRPHTHRRSSPSRSRHRDHKSHRRERSPSRSREDRHRDDHHKHSHRHHKKKDKRHRKHKRRSSPRHSSISSSASSRSSSSSSPSKSTKPPKVEPKEEDVRIEAEVSRAEKKPKNYIELMNKAEEEEFTNLLKKRHEQSKKEESVNSDAGTVSSSLNNKEFGKALLPGEGAAMAAFVAEGKRIPRRGEIGLTSDEIEKFERQGFVMSGSRHRRMEAVRLRKESQIYSADEKRLLADLNREERDKKHQKTISYFGQIIEQSMDQPDSNR